MEQFKRNENKNTGPTLDELLEKKRLAEQTFEFEMQALATKLARLEEDQVKLEATHKHFFAKEKGWQEKRLKQVKMAEGAVVGGMLTLAAFSGDTQKKLKKAGKQPEAKVASVPEKKHTHGHKSGHSGKKTVTLAEALADSSAAPVVPLRHDSVSAVPNPDFVLFPSGPGEPSTLDTIDTHGFAGLNVAPNGTPEVLTNAPKSLTSEHIDALAVSAPQQFEVNPQIVEHFDERELPTLPPFSDTLTTPEAVMVTDTASPAVSLEPRREDSVVVNYPESTAPIEPDAIPDHRTFDMSEIMSDTGTIVRPLAPAQNFAPQVEDTTEEKIQIKAKKQKLEPEKPSKHGIKVSYEKGGNPDSVLRTPVVETSAVHSELGTRLDSVYTEHSKELGDTSTNSEYEVTIQPGMEKFLRANGDTVRIDTLPSGETVVRTFNGHGFVLGKNKKEYMRDLEKRKIAGDFTVPEILKYRIDTAAWEKLQDYGMPEQRVYIDKVASKENIGPWMIASKARGTLLVFNEDNTIKAEIPFLFGATRGDGFNTYTSDHNAEGRTTPSGKWVLIKADEKTKKSLVGQFGHDAEKNIWQMAMLMPDGTIVNEGIALHGEISKDVEGQEKDVHSKDGRLHEETIGCERVDDAALAVLAEYPRYVQYVLSEDPELSYDIADGQFHKLTKEQVRKKISDRILKFWNDNPVLYTMKTEVVQNGKNNVAEQVSTYYRDENADQKIQPVDKKNDMKKVKVPRFIKR